MVKVKIGQSAAKILNNVLFKGGADIKQLIFDNVLTVIISTVMGDYIVKLIDL